MRGRLTAGEREGERGGVERGVRGKLTAGETEKEGERGRQGRSIRRTNNSTSSTLKVKETD